MYTIVDLFTHSTYCAVGEECLQTTQDLQKRDTTTNNNGETNNSDTAADPTTVDMDTDDHISHGHKVTDELSVQKPERGIALKYSWGASFWSNTWVLSVL